MTEAEYVFCKWKKRLWPAKVLYRNWASRRQCDQDKIVSVCIEIFCQNKQVNVCCADVEPLKKETIEDIASKLGQNKKSGKSTEELVYRRALREALNLFHHVTPSRGNSPLKGKRKKPPAQKDTLEEALLPLAPTQRLSSHKDPSKRVKEQEVDDASEATAIKNNESVLCSPDSPNHKLSDDGELAGQQHRAISKAKTARTCPKELQSSPRINMERKSPCSSKEAVEDHEVTDSPALLPLDYLARTSTPAESPSHKRRSRSTPLSKKSSRRPGPRKSLLASPTDGALVASELSEEGEDSPRKYSRVPNEWTPQGLEWSGHPEGLDGAPTPKDVVSSPAQKRRRRLCLEDLNAGLSPEGSDLEREREDSWNMDGGESKLQGSDTEEGLDSSSDRSLQLSPVRESSLSPAFRDDDDEEELPSFLVTQEPGSIEEGMLVWCKHQRYPYWPAVVRNVKRKAKKASVVFIEKRLEAKRKGLSTSLRKLKHFDCKEKQKLIDAARVNYNHEINWCINLIEDYRIRVGCRSFVGSFLEYFCDAMSYPVRKEGLNVSQMNFPQVEEQESQSSHTKSTPTRMAKKVLPNRMRAARDRANVKIVDFIVKARGADNHLQSVLKRQKPSRWLAKFLHARPYLTCIETYLEDESQQDRVYNYLKGVYHETDAKILPHVNGDNIRFILDVLFPEAVIYAISAVDQIDYKKAEEKYIRGPLVSRREREIFEEEILEQKRKQHLQNEELSVEDSL